MSEVKVGGRIGLSVVGISDDGHPVVNTNYYRAEAIDPAYIVPLPRPMTDAETALVDAALEYFMAPSGSIQAHRTLMLATNTVICERARHDPLAEIKAIVMNDVFVRKELQNAIGRLEEKLKESK